MNNGANVKIKCSTYLIPVVLIVALRLKKINNKLELNENRKNIFLNQLTSFYKLHY